MLLWYSFVTSWSWLGLWRGKLSRHSRRMRKPQLYVSGKRPVSLISTLHGQPFLIPLIRHPSAEWTEPLAYLYWLYTTKTIYSQHPIFMFPHRAIARICYTDCLTLWCLLNRCFLSDFALEVAYLHEKIWVLCGWCGYNVCIYLGGTLVLNACRNVGTLHNGFRRI